MFVCILYTVANAAYPFRLAETTVDYQNDWDQKLDYEAPSDSFICGFYSYHDNQKEDRRWKIKYCRYPYVSTSQRGKAWANNGQYCNAYDSANPCNCPSGKAVVGVYSVHSNSKEDRKWKIKCAKMSGVTISTTSCRDSGYKNSYDQALNYQMSNPYVMVGLLSDHDNKYEDRQYAFKECKVTYNVQSQDLQQPTNRYVVWTGTAQSASHSTGNSGWYNSHDGTFNFKADINHDGAFMCGMKTAHSNQKEDRQFKFATCSFGQSSASRSKPSTSSWCNNYDGWLSCTCPSGKAMYGVYSKHSNQKEDRRWKIHCSKVSGITVQTNRCYETEYINGWDSTATFETKSANMVFVGMRGYHSNGHEDRRYKFKVCRVKVPSSGRRRAERSALADRLSHISEQRDLYKRAVFEENKTEEEEDTTVGRDLE